jgi:uncharacterized protein YggT (Ycf19 family)
MESILLFLAQPFFLFFNLLINLKIFFSTGFVSLKEDVPAIINILNFLKDCLLIYLQGYNLIFTLRFILLWFPNINPFVAPYYIIRVLTQPFIDWVEKRLPRVFGIDLSFLVCSLALGMSINYLSTFKF